MSPEMACQLAVLHMGALHGYEKALTLALAFGPFVVLGTVIAARRRHDKDPDDRAADRSS
jgi:hypothetical protein